MKKNLASLLFSIILLGLFSNCKKDSDCDQQPVPENDYIIFGHFYGMCYGETCVEIYKIENLNLYEDTLDHYPSSAAPYNGIYIPLSSAKYELVKDLVNYVPEQLLSESDTIIGIPDAYDQGGYYLEVKENGEKRFWLIDKDSTPPYLDAFMDTLSNYIDRISD